MGAESESSMQPESWQHWKLRVVGEEPEAGRELRIVRADRLADRAYEAPKIGFGAVSRRSPGMQQCVECAGARATA